MPAEIHAMATSESRVIVFRDEVIEPVETQFSITIRSRDDVFEFARQCIVPFHIDGRKTRHTELWILSRYWLGLADAELLPYPLTARKSESPDFIVEHRDGKISGLEVTEASTADFHRDMVRLEKDARSETKVDRSITDRGWVGDEPERGRASLVFDAIQRKAAKLESKTWAVATKPPHLL